MTNLVYVLLIGLAAGWIAGQIMKGGKLGLVGDLVIGVVGAFLGSFAFDLLGLTATTLLGKLVCATAGACLLIAILRALDKKV